MFCKGNKIEYLNQFWERRMKRNKSVYDFNTYFRYSNKETYIGGEICIYLSRA
jgi:hypothetical protein